MSDFIWHLLLLLKWLKDKLHKLTSWSINSLALLILLRPVSLRFSFDCLGHDKLECYVDNDLKILILTPKALLARIYRIEFVLDLMSYEICDISCHHVDNHFFLGIKNNVSELAKVFYDYLCFIILIEKQLVVICNYKFGVLDKLFN
jgi:hypothetical protein